MGIKEIVLEEAKKGNVVIMTIEGPAVMAIDDIINQPTDGLLYDLNRTPEGILTFINDPRWVNDFAVYLVIKRLKEMVDGSKIICENCHKEIKGKVFTTDDGYHLCRKCVREINKEEKKNADFKRAISESPSGNPYARVDKEENPYPNMPSGNGLSG